MQILDWHTYLNHLKDMIDNMKKSHELTNVTLNCENSEQFKVNKIFLKACSPDFQRMIKSNLSENIPVIYLKGIQQEEMDSILESIYLNLAKFYEKKMNEFLHFARNIHSKVAEEEETSSKEIEETIDIDKMMEENDDSLADFTVDPLSNITDYDFKENHDDSKMFIYKQESKNKVFPMEQNLQRPIKAIHAGFTFSCKECGKQYTNHSSLRHHVNSVHKGIAHNCDQCSYKGQTQYHLEHHIQAVHEGVRYPCGQCNFRAYNRANLHKHIQTKPTSSSTKKRHNYLNF